eukprot:42611-Lingulodinium_polyedra.AAC.1
MQCKLSGSSVSDLLQRSPMQERLAAIEGNANDAEDGKPETEGPLNVDDVDDKEDEETDEVRP